MFPNLAVKVKNSEGIRKIYKPFRHLAELASHDNAMIGYDHMNAVEQWCRDQFGNPWVSASYSPGDPRWRQEGPDFLFVDENDVLAFKLRWHAGEAPRLPRYHSGFMV